jgi:nicotinate-nucleotide pyrophosphorylase (carboxylating)
MTMPFTRAETEACQSLVKLALREDLNDAGDITTLAFIPASQSGAATILARSPGVLAGLDAVGETAKSVDPDLAFHPLLSDGAILMRGNHIATIRGSMRSILSAERTMLNFLQRLSGVATQTRKYVDLVAGLPVQVLDTRKTTPGWRLLEKYAVRVGGGHNHRVGLYDMVLIKDNHLKALANDVDPIGTAIRKARAKAGATVQVEIEVESFEQFDRALSCEPDMILLDNMSLDNLRECVRRRNRSGSKVLLEASGGVTLETLRAIATTGVDRISVGALTHSAVALDIALDYGA